MLVVLLNSSENPLAVKKPTEAEKPKKKASRWEKEEPKKEVKKDPFKPPKPGEKRKSALDEIMEVMRAKLNCHIPPPIILGNHNICLVILVLVLNTAT